MKQPTLNDSSQYHLTGEVFHKPSGLCFLKGYDPSGGPTWLALEPKVNGTCLFAV
jgi:hypothetical protein